jgi:23S rRNA (cytidine1920-2'-O)/16S rRNA (cytidine1409-2'-O)-methyltransferase
VQIAEVLNGMTMSKKERLDLILSEKYPEYSRRQIQSWIMQGKARVDGQVQTKPGTILNPSLPIELIVEEPKFVSRAGFKIEAALNKFDIDVTNLVVMDAGLSTGGFTDCMLQRGARKVYGVDVGYGQVHEKICNDDRVIVMERTNLRHLETVGEPVDLVTLDLSFISIIKVMDAVCRILKPDGRLLVLIKPQFEAPRGSVNRRGVIKDEALREQVVNSVVDGIKVFGFSFQGIVDSPIFGAQGNKEFVAYFERILGDDRVE